MHTSIVGIAFLLCLRWSCCDVNECVLPNSTDRQADYYWRDYVGIVPADAVKGGFDEANNTTYIGQLLLESHPHILPAVIHPGKREAVACGLSTRYSSKKYVRILCSPRKLSWIPVELHELHLLTNYHIVIGGFEAGDHLYIGRANYQGQVQTGKVFPHHSAYRGLKLLSEEDSEHTLLSFELLVVQIGV